jgi:hypothetical protein
MVDKPLHRFLSLALLVGLAAGCTDATGPQDPVTFDAEGALEDYRALDDILSSSAMVGFRAMAEGVSLGSLQDDPGFALARETLAGAAGLTVPSSPETARAFAAEMIGLAARAPADIAHAPIISERNRGKTFVYDPGLGRYVHDPERQDAPSTGIRWILYEDDGTGHPDPDREMGYVDLIDEGDGSDEDIALALLVVVDGVVRLDYRPTLDVRDGSGRITVDGFIRGEEASQQLDFHIEVEGTESPGSSTFDISFQMGIDSRNFRITGALGGVEESGAGTGSIDIAVEHGDDSIRVEATGNADLIDGGFYVNGDVFATVTGDPDEPTVESASGEPLTGAEALVLHHILDVVEDVMDLFEDLLDPVDELILLSLIL